MICLWAVRGVSVDYSRAVREVSVDCQKDFYNLTVGCPWTVRGNPADFS